MRLAHTILVGAILTISEQHEITKQSSGGEKRVVCYYTNWSVYRPGTAKFNPQNINPYLCTHLIYAFGGLDRENGLRPYDKYQDIEQGGYAKFTGLKTYNKQLKTLLAIGGWNEGSARFSPLVADEERRKEFVKNVIKFLRQNHFDGLDLDWEYPAYRDGGKPRDKDNYAQLVQELREEFERESSKTGRPRLLLTMAVPAGIEYIDKGYDIPKLNRYLDFMNILSYDYHSAFEPSVNHHSPLYSIEEESEYNFDSQLTIDATVKHYLMKGADAEKLVLGIPTYGRSYTLFNPESTELGAPSDGPGEQGEATREKGYLAYYEICNNIKDGWTVVQPKESAMGPYAYKDNQWVGYDDEAIVKKKSQYVNEKNLGGIMFWSIDNDDFRGKCHSRPYPLIEAAKEALLGKGVSNKLPSGGRGGKTKAGKAKATQRTTTTQLPPSATVTTPEPPTTPDPGSDFVCKDEGFFPHPRDCKKYFWCLDSGPSDLGIVAHQFTCPSGLYFNKAADSCDFSRNVICKKKSSSTTTASTTTSSTTTTTSAPKTNKLFYTKSTLSARFTTSTTTTTTTTPEPPVFEEEIEEDEDYKEEDPQTIKQLIQLIKKLGGVAELEKQLEGSAAGVDSTTPAISKSLYERVISSGSPRYQSIQRNGPSGPQNEGLPKERSSFRREKPQYVTIKRERPTTSTTESADIVYAVEEEVDDDVEAPPAPKYKTIFRNRESQSQGANEYEKPKYQSSERFRPKVRTEETPEKSTTLKYTSILRSRAPTPDSTATTSKYVVLQRQRTTNQQPADVGTTENELNDEEEVTENIIETTTTSRPRVKVSDIVATTVSVPTSTRVVTEIVEGATRRQRVPLSKLRHFLKDLDNSVIESVTPEQKPLTTTEEDQTERPLLHGFIRRRPEIVITTTARTTPAFLAARRNRFRSTTVASEVSTRGRFVPSRNRNKTSEITKDEHRFKPHSQHYNDGVEDELKSITENSTSSITVENITPRNRFSFRRRTTTKPESKSPDNDDEVFIRGSSKDTNIIRKPVYKPRFPSRRRSTTPESIPEASSSPTTVPTSKLTEAIPSTSEVPVLNNWINTTSPTLSNDNSTATLTQYNENITITSTLLPKIGHTTTEVYVLPTTILIPKEGEITSSSEKNEDMQIDNFTQKEVINYSSNAVSIGSVSEKNLSELNLETTTKETVDTNEELDKQTSLPYEYTTEDIPYTTIVTTDKPPKTIQNSEDNLLRLNSRFNHGRKFINSQNNNNPLTFKNSTKVTQPERDARKKIVLRRKKPSTEPNITLDSKDNGYKTNRTSVIRRKRPQSVREERIDYTLENNTTSNDLPKKVQRGKIRFYSIKRNEDRTTFEDNLASPTKDTSRTRSHLKITTINSETVINATDAPHKHKRIIIRGRKKFTGNETDPSKHHNVVKPTKIENYIQDREASYSDLYFNANKTVGTNKHRNKVRKVIVRKPVKDLAVGESISPGKGGSYDNPDLETNPSLREANSQANGDLDINYSEDIIQTNNGKQEIQSRGRRPFRKTVVRSTTTTTEPPSTTTRQRTTIQTLRQRLNRFKVERNFPKATSASAIKESDAEYELTTTRPVVRKEYRRLVKPLRIDDSQLDASHDVSQNTPQNDIRPTRPHKPLQEQATEGSQFSEEYIDEEPLVLPDLANVAVAAIQSLATSPPPPTTQEYKTPAPVRAKTSRPVKVVARRPSRPPTSAPPVRSSPRPFSKVNYDDYEDYYAEPVDVPLSGKVRIHNDGYIECLDVGNFPHPFSCRKFISCAKMENSHLLGWEYTCPKGLSFDPIGGICNWNAGLGCKD